MGYPSPRTRKTRKESFYYLHPKTLKNRYNQVAVRIQQAKERGYPVHYQMEDLVRSYKLFASRKRLYKRHEGYHGWENRGA